MLETGCNSDHISLVWHNPVRPCLISIGFHIPGKEAQVVLCSDVEEGGATFFPHSNGIAAQHGQCRSEQGSGLRIIPRQGCTILFWYALTCIDQPTCTDVESICSCPIWKQRLVSEVGIIACRLIDTCACSGLAGQMAGRIRLRCMQLRESSEERSGYAPGGSKWSHSASKPPSRRKITLQQSPEVFEGSIPGRMTRQDLKHTQVAS